MSDSEFPTTADCGEDYDPVQIAIAQAHYVLEHNHDLRLIPRPDGYVGPHAGVLIEPRALASLVLAAQRERALKATLGTVLAEEYAAYNERSLAVIREAIDLYADPEAVGAGETTP